jgi:hypothetical protein
MLGARPQRRQAVRVRGVSRFGFRAIGRWAPASAGALALALAACGGGGGGAGYTSIPPPPPGALGVNPLALNSAGTILSGIVPTAASAAVLGLVSVDFPAGASTPGTVLITGKAGATASLARSPSDEHRAAAANARAGALRPHAVTVRALSGPPPVGTQQTFFVAVSSTAGGPVTSYTQFPFTLVSASAHAAVWIEDADVAEFAPASSTFANDAEAAYAADTATIGPATYTDAAAGRTASVPYCDGAGNPAGTGPFYAAPFAYVNVLVVDPGTLGRNVGGEFAPTDTFAQAQLNCDTASPHRHSNEGGFIVAALAPTANVHYHVQQLLAHELTHLIQFVDQVIVLGRADAPPAIKEGLAELARDITLGAPDIGNVALSGPHDFLSRPQDYSILGFTGAHGNGSSGNYGGAYLLMRYIADRYGYGFVKTYVQNDPLTGTKGSYDALAAATGAPSFAALFRDFGAALAASAAGAPPQPPYAFTSIQFGHTYQNVQTNDALAATVTIPPVGTAGSAAFADNQPVAIYPGGMTLLNVPNPISQAQLYVTEATKTLGIDGVIVSR